MKERTSEHDRPTRHGPIPHGHIPLARGIARIAQGPIRTARQIPGQRVRPIAALSIGRTSVIEGSLPIRQAGGQRRSLTKTGPLLGDYDPSGRLWAKALRRRTCSANRRRIAPRPGSVPDDASGPGWVIAYRCGGRDAAQSQQDQRIAQRGHAE